MLNWWRAKIALCKDLQKLEIIARKWKKTVSFLKLNSKDLSSHFEWSPTQLVILLLSIGFILAKQKRRINRIWKTAISFGFLNGFFEGVTSTVHLRLYWYWPQKVAKNGLAFHSESHYLAEEKIKRKSDFRNVYLSSSQPEVRAPLVVRENALVVFKHFKRCSLELLMLVVRKKTINGIWWSEKLRTPGPNRLVFNLNIRKLWFGITNK